VRGHPLPFLVVTCAAAAVPAAADLEIRLLAPRTPAAPRPGAAQSAPLPTGAPRPLAPRAIAPRSAPARRLPVLPGAPLPPTSVRNGPGRSATPVGVRRRGGVPVLPQVGGLGARENPSPFGEGDGEDDPTAPASSGVQIPVRARLGVVPGINADVYRAPDPRAQWIGRLKQGQKVAITNQWQGWFTILMGDGSPGYVSQTHLELGPYQVTSVTPAAALPSFPPPGVAPTPSVSDGSAMQPIARAVIQEAFGYQDTPYVYGGNTHRGIDCSGLVKNCFSSVGFQLPRRASEQARVGQEVSLDQLQPGDRVYFSVRRKHDHTGIYVGNGYFIHASSARQKVAVDHLSTGLYARSLDGARR